MRALGYRLASASWPLISVFGAKTKFSFVYHLNLWRNPESISGEGSTLAYTENLRRQLPVVFEQYRVRRIFDAPCGDFNWFQYVARDGVHYLGGDIVDALIRNNRRRHGDGQTDFVRFDVCNTPFPVADLWLCRDCMFHLSNQDIRAAFDNFASSDIPYILTTSHAEATQNVELPRRGFRMLNLELPPYSLPRPLLIIEDWAPGFPRRILGLWRREDIQGAVSIWQGSTRQGL